MILETEAVRHLHHSVRTLLRSPGYAVTAVASVAGAIGLACSVAAVVGPALAGPPYDEPERVVELWQTAAPSVDQPQDYLAPLRMEEWVARGDFRTLESVAATGMGPTLILPGVDGATRVQTAPVLGDWFGLLGVDASRGRVLSPDDHRSGAPPAAVVSHTFWRERLGGAELGSMTLSGTSYTIVGVMPPSFEAAQLVWLPADKLPAGQEPGAYAGVGRLRAGASVSDAAAEVRQLAGAQVASDSALYAGLGATARPLGEIGRASGDPGLWMLVGVGVAVLLVALNNLTVLTLVRAQRQSLAMAVRASLGAGRWELARHPIAEGVVIAVVGSGLGLLLAVVGKDVAAGFLGGTLRPTLGLETLLLAGVLGGLAAILVGVEPTRRMAALDVGALLRRRSAGASSTPGERTTRMILVSIQIGVCMVLVAVTTVLGTAYRAFGTLDVGIDAAAVTVMSPDWDVAETGPAEQWRVADRLLARFEEAPGIESSTAWRMINQEYPPRPEYEAVTDGPEVELGRFDGLYRYYEVRPGFLNALGIDLIEGRDFTADDGRGTAPVAMVTARGASLWWPGMDPLGRQIKLGADGGWMTVVGVIEDIQTLDELGRSFAMNDNPRMPLLFMPAGQFEGPPPGWRPFQGLAGVRLGLRAPGESGPAIRFARQALAQEAPELPVASIGSLQEVQMRGYLGQWIAAAGRLVGIGVIIALALAALGIVGVVTEAVSRRTREIGVRVTVGARPHQVSWAVGREGLITACVGLVGGVLTLLVISAWLQRAVLFSVQRLAPPIDSAAVLATAVILVLGATGVTLFVATTRAHRIDPIEALRAE